MLLTQRLVLQFQELNRDENLHGIDVQLPLPEVVDSRPVLQAIDSEEHAFCLISQFNCHIFIGEADNPLHCRGRAMGLCTPRGIMELFNRYGTPLYDQRVPVEGSSRTLGLPLSHKYMRRLASVQADPVLACAAGGSC